MDPGKRHLMGFAGNETFTKMDVLQSDCMMLRTAESLSISAVDTTWGTNDIKILVVVLDSGRCIETVWLLCSLQSLRNPSPAESHSLNWIPLFGLSCNTTFSPCKSCWKSLGLTTSSAIQNPINTDKGTFFSVGLKIDRDLIWTQSVHDCGLVRHLCDGFITHGEEKTKCGFPSLGRKLDNKKREKNWIKHFRH